MMLFNVEDNDVFKITTSIVTNYDVSKSNN